MPRPLAVEAEVMRRRDPIASRQSESLSRTLEAGELSAEERALASPYHRARPWYAVPFRLRLALGQPRKHLHAKQRALTSMAAKLLLVAREEYGLRRDREIDVHIVQSTRPRAGARFHEDNSVSIHYSERLYLFLQFFNLLGQIDPWRRRHLKLLSAHGVTPQDMRTALLRFALIQQTLTDGQGFIYPPEGNLMLPGRGRAAHQFVLAHEIGHVLIRDGLVRGLPPDPAPDEHMVDRVAIELLDVAGLEGHRTAHVALTALAILEEGTLATWPGWERTAHARLERVTSSPSRQDADLRRRLDELQRAATFLDPVPPEAWQCIRSLIRLRRLGGNGDTTRGLQLADWANPLFEAAAAQSMTDAASGRGSREHRRDMAISTFAKAAALPPAVVKDLRADDGNLSIYDLIGWVLSGPEFTERAGHDHHYARAIVTSAHFGRTVRQLVRSGR